MPAPYPALAIANEFIRLSQTGTPITPMQLLKLVYFAEGWYSAYYDKALLDEEVQAWRYGPVVYSIYREVQEYGDQPITGFLSPFGFGDEDGAFAFCDENDSEAKGIIMAVWNVYKDMPAMKLSNITHAIGTPWRKLYDKFGGRLPQFLKMDKGEIQTYFKSLLSKTSS